MNYKDQIYFASVLLEKTRWSTRQASFLVSDWLPRIAGDGLAGIELWEYHYHQADETEKAKLQKSALPMTILNTYAGCDDADGALRDRATTLVKILGSQGMKFNVGPDLAKQAIYVKNVQQWRKDLPADFRMLCECHPGTIMEVPAKAEEMFRQFAPAQVEAILHPFLYDLEYLKTWFKHLGPYTTHGHIQVTNEKEERISLRDKAPFVREAVRFLKDQGYAGSFTLEFAAGTCLPGETMEKLYQSALDDRAFLLELLDR